MSEQERPLIDRVWEFTKDISVKVSRKAEKHWKINTLRVEIASIRHRINVKYKELGRYVYESVKSQTLEEDSYKASLREFFDELKRLEGDIFQRENRIEILEQEMRDASPSPPPFPGETSETEPTAEADVVDAEVVATSENEATPTESQEQAADATTAEDEPVEEASETSSSEADADSETDADSEDTSDEAEVTTATKDVEPEAPVEKKAKTQKKKKSTSK